MSIELNNLQIKTFFSENTDGLDREVNEWLKKNEDKTILEKILHTSNPLGMTVVIVYAPDNNEDED